MSWALVVGVAILGGLAVSTQAQLIGDIDRRVGTIQAVFVTYATGGLLIAGILLVSGGFEVDRVRALPWYSWMAGLTGLVIIGSISYGASRIGVVRTLTLVTMAQFGFAAAIDHFGLMGAEVRTIDGGGILGLLLLSAGTWLVLR